MRDENLLELLGQTAAKFGDHVAVECGPRRVSYLELQRRSNRLANFLIGNGAAKGSIIAVLTEDPVEAITAIIGILKAGCVFVPLDLDTPPKRLEAMLSLISPQWYFTDSHLFRAFVGRAGHSLPRARVICADGGRPPDERQNGFTYLPPYQESSEADPPQVSLEPDDMCYVYFTSGSTGTPKAIAGRYKAIGHFIRWEIETLGLGEGVRVSQLLLLSFDGSLRDIFVPLCAGGTVCVPEGRETILDARRLIDWIDGRRINVVHCVPSLFRSIVNEQPGAERFPALTHILMAGEPLLPADVGRWMDVYGDRVQLVNLYGTSETTMAKFSYFVSPADRERRSIPIGLPIEGAAALIVDERGRPCPPGVIGEIYIRTPYRSLGYYNQPELTKAAFIQNLFSNHPDDIVYKTGDMGRVLKDGNYEYLGRRDQQVKIRGLRVELAEIEGLLRGHEAVRDVAVVEHHDPSGFNSLCAYVVLDGQSDADQLRDYLSKYLPDYMLPSTFMLMESLPRTLSGKVDRRALPAPGRSRAGLKKEYVAPRTPAEETVAGIWSQLLGMEGIGIHDSFFEIGGHSLLGTQLLSRVRGAFGVDLPLRVLFESPTIAGLALAVTQAQLAQESDDEMARLIAEIESLPDEVLEKIIAEEARPAGSGEAV